MPMGPGKYDELCTAAREGAAAEGAILIVLEGSAGNGFSVQAPAHILHRLPALLRILADEIEADSTGPRR